MNAKQAEILPDRWVLEGQMRYWKQHQPGEGPEGFMNAKQAEILPDRWVLEGQMRYWNRGDKDEADL